MTWTYGGDPSANNRDEVRFLIGDVDSTQPLLTDEEIAYAIAELNSNYATAAFCIDRILSKGYMADREVGDLKISGSQVAAHLKAVKKDLLQRDSGSRVPFFGGMTEASRETYDLDTSLIQKTHWEGQFDHPGVNLPGDGLTANSSST
jgi:hypothetical protein